MFVKPTIVMLALMSAISAHAEEFCIRPLAGAEPVIDIESTQPRRIVSQPHIIPGYDGIVFNAYNRGELLHYDGLKLTKITDDFPHRSGFAYKNIHIAPNGDAYGFGAKPSGIYYLPKGEKTWKRLEGIDGYKSRRLFDRGAGDVVFWANGRWKRIRNGKLLGDFDFPGDNYKLVAHVQTVPELNGTFALIRPTDSINERRGSLWFKGENGGDWEIVDIPNKDMPYLSYNLDISVRDGVIRVMDSHQKRLLFLKQTQSGIKFLSVAPKASWREHEQTGNLVAWVGETRQVAEKTRFFGLFKSKFKLRPPKLSFIRSGTSLVEVISDVQPHKSITRGKVTYFKSVYFSPDNKHGFVHTDTGLGVFDGEKLIETESLSISRLGSLPSLKFIGSDTLIQSNKGIFQLTDNLTADRIDTFPIKEPWNHQVEIKYLQKPAIFLIADAKGKSFHTSPDMENFTKIDTQYEIKRIAAVVDDPPAAVLIGEDAIYNFTQSCQVVK